MLRNTRMANMLPEQAWRLGVAVVALCGMEVAAIVLPMHGRLLSLRWPLGMVIWGMTIGWIVETWLLGLCGHAPELADERLTTRPVKTAIWMSVTYWIPPFIGCAGLFAPWSQVLSILAFLGLLSRITWILSRPADLGEGYATGVPGDD